MSETNKTWFVHQKSPTTKTGMCMSACVGETNRNEKTCKRVCGFLGRVCSMINHVHKEGNKECVLCAATQLTQDHNPHSTDVECVF